MGCSFTTDLIRLMGKAKAENAAWSVKLLNAKAKSVERDFPHIVETAVPKASLSESVDAIYRFHWRHGIAARIGQEWLDREIAQRVKRENSATDRVECETRRSFDR